MGSCNKRRGKMSGPATPGCDRHAELAPPVILAIRSMCHAPWGGGGEKNSI